MVKTIDGSRSGNKNGFNKRLTTNINNDKLAPKDCPVRPRKTRMFAWYCRERCREYETFNECIAWARKEK
jgi:hypothetical protein